MRSLAGWDLAAWRMAKSDPALRATVVGVVELVDLVPSEALVSRISVVVAANPILRSLVIEDEQGAHFEELVDIDVKSHLDMPATVMDLSSVVAEFAQRDFDLSRPLWRILIVSTGHRTTLVGAFHHAIADGQTAMGLLGQLLDEPPVLPTVRSATHSSADSAPPPPIREAMQPVIDRLVKDPVGLAGDLNRIAQSVNSLLQIPTPSKTQRRGGRIYFSAWETTTTEIQHNVTDSLIAIGVELWHAATGHKDLVVNVPVSAHGGRGVNQFTIARLKMKAQPEAPDLNIAESRTALVRWRNEPANALLPHIVELSQFLPTQMISSLVKQSAVSVTSLKGGHQIGSIAGVQVGRVIPLVTPTGVAVNITAAVLGNRVMIGVSADGAVFDSRAQLISHFEQAAVRVLGFTPTRLTL